MKNKRIEFRSELARAFHNIVMDYIRKGDSSKFDQELQKTDSSVLCQLSINGCSHLIDALHLPYAIYETNKTLADKRSQHLFTGLIKRATQLGKESLLFLLTERNKEGFSPLHCVLKSGQPENVRAYFDAINGASKKRWINNEVYCTLLTATNDDGFTPLHQALKSGDPKNVRVYFDAIHQAREENWLSKKEYCHLLTATNKAGFNPLHEALISGYP